MENNNGRGISVGDQKVYFGGKRYTRRVWNLHKRTSDGARFGFVQFAGQQVKVWEIGSGDFSHWDTMDPATAESRPMNDFEMGLA